MPYKAISERTLCTDLTRPRHNLLGMMLPIIRLAGPVPPHRLQPPSHHISHSSHSQQHVENDLHPHRHLGSRIRRLFPFLESFMHVDVAQDEDSDPEKNVEETEGGFLAQGGETTCRGGVDGSRVGKGAEEDLEDDDDEDDEAESVCTAYSSASGSLECVERDAKAHR